ncbi:ECF RNA polymerase sigma factor SigK [Microlunatus speluncae]|uniref:ECF RNA polymerase sigma factor SigK n=1 Tax=Microlunatus speluncae TaxID=2594267 RepID=UPI00126642C4|nr:ECF RNA polymerase sigma factor SigK [Microlunatus speluncae]
MNSDHGERRARLTPVPDPPRSEPDRLVELLGRTARGHEDAFETLYDLTSTRVYGVVLRVLRSPDQAAEVAQEAYLEAWKQSARYRPELGSVLAWLLTIAHRRAVDRVRSVTSQTGRDERYGREQQPEASDVVWDDVSRQVDVERVRRAMRSLTEVQREALSLAYFGGYTHRQVARMLSLPLGTAKTRIRDGLIGLRDALGVES